MNINSAFINFNFNIAIIIFIAYVLVDGMYAYYTIQVTKKKPISAATIGALMHFLLAFGVLNYVQNFLYLIPLALGSWIGTYLVVRKEQKLDDNRVV
jgi:uncharacterized membrane protein YfcA